MSTQDTTLPPLPEPAYKRVCLKYAGGDTPSLYKEGWVIVELDAFSEDQMRAAIAAQAQQAQGVPVGFVRTSMLAAAPQAEPVQAQDTLSVVRRFERMVGDYNCLFTEYQGKTMPADVYQRFTALREERIPTARKELADLLAAAPQATHEANTHSAGAGQDELVERVMRSAQTLVLAVHFKRPKADQDALRNNLRMEVRAALAEPQAEPQPEREPLTAAQVCQIVVDAGYDMATANQRADFMNGLRHGERAHGIGTKGGDKP